MQCISTCYAALGRVDLAYKYNEINAETGSNHQASFYRLLYLIKKSENLEGLRHAFTALLDVSRCIHCDRADKIGVDNKCFPSDWPAEFVASDDAEIIFKYAVVCSEDPDMSFTHRMLFNRRDRCHKYIRDAALLLTDHPSEDLEHDDAFQW